MSIFIWFRVLFLLLYFSNISWNWYIVILLLLDVLLFFSITFFGLSLFSVYSLVIFVQSVSRGSLFDYISLFLLLLCCSRNGVFVLVVLVLILFLLFLSSFLFVRLTQYESNFIVVDIFYFMIWMVFIVYCALGVALFYVRFDLVSMFILLGILCTIKSLVLSYCCNIFIFYRYNCGNHASFYVIYFVSYWMKFLSSNYDVKIN